MLRELLGLLCRLVEVGEGGDSESGVHVLRVDGLDQSSVLLLSRYISTSSICYITRSIACAGFTDTQAFYYAFPFTLSILFRFNVLQVDSFKCF
jgi:hypothetical protein